MSPVIHWRPIMAWQKPIVNAWYHQTGGRQHAGLSVGPRWIICVTWIMQTLAISALYFVYHVLVIDNIGGISSRAHHAWLNINGALHCYMWRGLLGRDWKPFQGALKGKFQVSPFRRNTCRAAWAVTGTWELLIVDAQHPL